MDKIVTVVSIVLPVLIAMGIGYFAKKKNIFSAEGVEGMKGFVTKFCLPLVIFGTFYNATF